MTLVQAFAHAETLCAKEESSFSSFEWDEGIARNVKGTGSSIQEIEHLLTHAETLIRAALKNPTGETRFLAIGRTQEGRYAFVIFTPRSRGAMNPLRPISTRFMHRRERSENMNKKLPALRNDKEAEKLLAEDLSKYIRAESLVPFGSNLGPSKGR